MIPVLLIVIPLLAGLVGFFIKDEKLAKAWSLLAAIGVAVVSILGLTLLKDPKWLSHQSVWMQPLGSSFSVKLDGMGQLLCLLNAIAFPLIFIGTWHNSYPKANRFYALMLLAQAGMMGVFVAMDALLFYFFWELALIPMYFLASIWGGEKRIRVTFKFFIYTFVGSVLMLIGIIYIQSKTPDQSFSIESFYKLGQTGFNNTLIFWFFFAAFAIKMPIFPVHTWQPDAYEQAPTPATMVLSGVMVKMGLLGLIRWLLPVLPNNANAWSDAIPPLALVGLIYASLIAIRQDDIKRLVAYSSIAHIGLMCASVFTFNKYGMQGVMIQMFAHGVNIIGMWILVEIIEKRYGTRKISELGGLAQQAPATVLFFVIIALANIALPLTNAFVGEFLMFNGIMNAHPAQLFFKYWWLVMAGMGIILGAVYTLNLIRKVFYGERHKTLAVEGGDLRLNEKVALGIIVVMIFWFGICPQSMLNLTESTSQAVIDLVTFKGKH
jgi:NADH-quinone oxidoreductase subunit M